MINSTETKMELKNALIIFFVPFINLTLYSCINFEVQIHKPCDDVFLMDVEKYSDIILA